MGYLEFIMSQEQVYNLILTLVNQGVLDPDDIRSFVDKINASLFS